MPNVPRKDIHDPIVGLASPLDKPVSSARIFVADDHPMVLDSIRLSFQSLDMSIDVKVFAGILELESAIDRESPPDLVLIDFDMPGLASVDAVVNFVRRHANVPIGVISGHTDSQLALDLIRNGCLGFIPKSLPSAAIYHAVRLMLSGARFMPDLLTESPRADIPPSQTVPRPAGQNRSLTRREVEVLRSLASGNTNKQIAKDLNIEEVTVKIHLRNSYSKLGVRNRVGAVRAVLSGAIDSL